MIYHLPWKCLVKELLQMCSRFVTDKFAGHGPNAAMGI